MEPNDYRIVVEYDSLVAFEHDVKAALDDGWQLFGPPTVGVRDGGEHLYYAQALIKK